MDENIKFSSEKNPDLFFFPVGKQKEKPLFGEELATLRGIVNISGARSMCILSQANLDTLTEIGDPFSECKYQGLTQIPVRNGRVLSRFDPGEYGYVFIGHDNVILSELKSLSLVSGTNEKSFP